MSSYTGSASLSLYTALPQGLAGQYIAASVADEKFKELLKRIADRFPSKKAFAEAMDIDPSRLTRALNTGDFPFNVVNCLRLAKISGESPAEILRTAGKADVAELIESLYGKDRTRLLTAEERELLDTWKGFTPDTRQALLRSFAELSGRRTKSSPARPLRRRSAP